MTTYRLLLSLPASASNVYAFAGTPLGDLAMPPAYQVASPFGADIGGVSPAISAVMAEAEFDSWLTTGETEGSAPNAISASPDLGLDAWTAAAGFNTNNGAIFWLNPARGPSGSDIAMAQLTVPSASDGSASGVVQGRPTEGLDLSLIHI